MGQRVKKPADKTKSITIKDIAAKLNLSFQAVSQALNPRTSKTTISKKTQQKIITTAEAMGYRPHTFARSLRSGKSGYLGILIFDHPFKVMHHRLHHVLEEVRLAGFRPFVHLADTSKSDETLDGCLAMLDVKVEGVILVDPINVATESFTQVLTDESIPVVSLGSNQWNAIPSYQADRKSGFSALTEHLILQGCKSICLLRAKVPPSAKAASERFLRDMTMGFRNTIKRWQAKGLVIEGSVMHTPYHMEKIGEPSEIHSIYQSGYHGMKSIIRKGILPDGLLCQADFWAQGALRACDEVGISVPGQMRIAGFNNEPSSSAGLLPLTTIEQPGAELARQAITDLVAMIKGEDTLAPGQVTTLPGKLILRKSTQRTKGVPCSS